MKKKTVVSVMAVAMLFAVSLFFVGGTYARYASEFEGEASVDVAKWAVKVGGQESETLNLDFQVQDNEYVVADKIAPSVTATAKTEVDLTGTEVAVDLIVEKGADFDSAIEELGLHTEEIVFGVKLADGTSLVGSTGTGTQEDPFVIPLQSAAAFTTENGKIGVELSIEWTNDDQDNATDTKVGKAGGKLTVPVTLTVQQHIAEA